MANPWERDWSQPTGGVYIPPSESGKRKRDAESGVAQNQQQITGVEAQYAPQVVQGQVAKTGADIQSTQVGTQGQVIKNTAEQINLERGSLSDESRRMALGGYDAAREIRATVAELRKQYEQGKLSKTSGWSGLKDFLPSGENSRFNTSGNRSRGYIKQALGFTGGESNTMAESDATYGPYLPSNWDSNETVESKLQFLESLADSSERKAVQMLGGTPDASGKIHPLPIGEDGRPYIPQANLAQKAGKSDTFLSAEGRGGIKRDPALSGFGDEIRQAFVNGASSDQLIAMEARKMAELGRPLSPERVQFYRELDDMRAQSPNTPLNGFGVNWGSVENAQESEDTPLNILGMAAEVPFAGPALVNAANAATLGIPAAMSENGAEKLALMSEESPVSSFIGDAAGSTAAILGGMAYGPAFAKKAAGLVPESAYSTVRGGIEGGPVGAGVGAALGLAGNRVGAGFGGGAHNVTARLSGDADVPDDYMRVLTRNMEPQRPDEIATALIEGRGRGAPLNVLDVAPELLPMGGAAFRRTEPNTRMAAAEGLVGRAENQSSRLDDAIARELGPIQNPATLQAKYKADAVTDSTPQYEAFRAEVPQTSAELATILETDFGKRAIAEANKVANARGEVFDPLSPTPAYQDRLMRAMRDSVDWDVGPFSGVGKDISSAHGDLYGRFVAELDKLYPDTYPHARKLYRDNMEMADAVESGTQFLGRSRHVLPSEVPAPFTHTSEPYQAGARAALSDVANKPMDSVNPWPRALGSGNSRQNFETVFGADPTEQMLKAYDLEKDMIRTSSNLIGNSATVQRGIDDSMFSDETTRILSGALIDAATNPTGTGVLTAGLGLARNAAKDRVALGSFRNLEGIGTKITGDVLDPSLDPLLFKDRLAEAIAYNLAKQNAARYGSAVTTGGFNSLGGIQ